MDNKFFFNRLPSGWEIRNEMPICGLKTTEDGIIAAFENGAALYLKQVESEEGFFSGNGLEMRYNVKEIENGFYYFEHRFKNKSGRTRSLVFQTEIETYFKPSFYMIPSVSYNGNKWGTGNEPKGLEYEKGRPWIFAYNRVSLPSATFSEDDSVSFGLYAAENSKVSACSMTETGEGMIHRLYWPDRDEPLTYYSRDEYAPPSTPVIILEPEAEFTAGFFISLNKVGRKNFGWTNTFDRFSKHPDNNKNDLPVAMRASEFWERRVSFIKNTQYIKEQNKYDLFDIGMLPNGTITNYFGDPPGAVWRSRSLKIRHYEIGWCGQNASEAVSLIHDYIINNDKDSLQTGLSVLDTWAAHAALPSGLFIVEFDDLLGTFDKPFDIDTCNLGWGIWQMLEAWEALQAIGVDKPAYKSMALDACDFFTKNRAPDGSFGKTWKKDGTPDDPGGSIGCYILLGLVKAFAITKDEKYLRCAEEMFGFYVERDLNAMACTAGALDTHCIDKETCWPLLKTGLDLYEITGNRAYLDDALHAAYYILSFTFLYDTVNDDDSDFAVFNYRTYGGTSVSTQHHHLDPWGSLISYDFYRLYKKTGDEKWNKWAAALWRNAMIGVSNGTMVVHGLTRPSSAQNEIFLQSRFTFKADCKPGRFNDWLTSWPGAFKLITIRRARQDGLDVADIFEK